jgi:hypothetical protein
MASVESLGVLACAHPPGHLVNMCSPVGAPRYQPASPPGRGQASLQRFSNVVGEEPLREHFVRPIYDNANIIVANYSLKEGSSRERDNVVDHASPPTAERTPRFRWGLRLRFCVAAASVFDGCSQV